MKYEGPNRRRVFRLRLPEDALLVASINGITYEVIEVAEFSLVVTTDQVVNLDGVCSGTMHWSDGTSSPFTGDVGRLGHLGRVIGNINGIQTRDVVREQRKLIAKFPATNPLRKVS